MKQISVVILTKNEQRDLAECLGSLGWCDDIHVVDSLSTDRTVELARTAGAHVYENPFISFGDQRNWALDHCHISYPWVLFIDADERTPRVMVEKMEEAVANAPETVAGFYCCWKLMLNGRWLKRADNFPKWQFRLLRKKRASFTDFGHGQKEGVVDGEIHYLCEPYLHFAFSRGWDDWQERHRRYAKKEAVARSSKAIDWRALFSRHASKRTPMLKIIVSQLPGWPLLRFLYPYFICGGIFEGREALIYCSQMMWFERLVQREIKKLRSI